MQQRRYNSKLLFHTMGIRRNQIPKGFRYFKFIPVPLDPFLPLFCRNLENIGNKVQILDACQILIQIRIIRNICRHLFAHKRIIMKADSSDPNLSRIISMDPGNAFQRCCLPGSIMPDECADITRHHMKAQIRDALAAALIVFRQMIDNKHCFPPVL